MSSLLYYWPLTVHLQIAIQRWHDHVIPTVSPSDDVSNVCIRVYMSCTVRLGRFFSVYCVEG
jgi:hypothetical protein